MNIVDFFNPNDIDHLHAYNILQKTGHWPNEFLPNDIEFDAIWQVSLMNKIAQCWIDYKLSLELHKISQCWKDYKLSLDKYVFCDEKNA